MKSKIDPQFRKLLRGLPHDVRAQARASYRLFKRDPYHPSLHFKEIDDDVYSARIGIKYRVLGTRVADDLMMWWWIGTHTEYHKMLKK